MDSKQQGEYYDLSEHGNAIATLLRNRGWIVLTGIRSAEWSAIHPSARLGILLSASGPSIEIQYVSDKKLDKIELQRREEIVDRTCNLISELVEYVTKHRSSE